MDASTSTTSRAQGPTPPAARVAPWLLSPYDAPVWTVADDDDPGRTEDIDFRWPMPDGSSLLDNPALLATARELAFWVRDPAVSRRATAYNHRNFVRSACHVLHAVRRLGVRDVGRLTAADVDHLKALCAGGVDALLDSVARARAFCRSLVDLRDREPDRFAAGLAPLLDARGTFVSIRAVLRACNLPANLKSHEVASAVRDALGAVGHLRFYPLPPRSTGAADRRRTERAILEWYRVLDLLWRMRDTAACGTLAFPPFPDGGQALAARSGRPSRATPTPPPALVLHLLGGAFDWVVGGAAAILDELAEHEARWSDRAGGRTEDGLRRRVLLLWGAALVVVAAFTARRRSEVTGLVEGCLRGGDDGGWWLRVRIAKNIRDDEWIPVPRCVARAVEVLVRVSGPARAASGDGRILLVLLPGDAAPILPDAIYWTNALAEAVGVPAHALPDGTQARWRWNVRAFRRFFAVLYFYRYENSSIEALAHMLRHFDVESTRAYVQRDPEAARLWLETERGFMAHLAEAIATGERPARGGMGKRLTRLAATIRSRMLARVHVAPPGRVSSALVTAMGNKGLVLTPKRWTICSCPSTTEGARRARCRKAAPSAPTQTGPSFAAAGPAVCPSCAWSIEMPEHAPYVGDEARGMRLAAASPRLEGTVVGDFLAAGVAAIEATAPGRAG